MSLQSLKLVCESVALLALAGSAAFSAWKIGQASNQAMVTMAKVQTTVDAINAPCTGFHGSVTCGPLAQLSQTEKNIGILAGQTALQVKQSSTLVNSSASAVQSAAQDIHRLTESAQGTLDAGTSTLRASQAQIEAAGPVLASAQTAVGYLDTTVQDLDAQIKATDLPGLTRQLTDASGQLNHTLTNVTAITGDTKQVADKMTADYLKPVPWWKWPIQKFGDAWDILGAVARHTP